MSQPEYVAFLQANKSGNWDGTGIASEILKDTAAAYEEEMTAEESLPDDFSIDELRE